MFARKINRDPETDSLTKDWNQTAPEGEATQTQVHSKGRTRQLKGAESPGAVGRSVGGVGESGCEHATTLGEDSVLLSFTLHVPLGFFRIPQWNLPSKSCCLELFYIHMNFFDT